MLLAHVSHVFFPIAYGFMPHPQAFSSGLSQGRQSWLWPLLQPALGIFLWTLSGMPTNQAQFASESQESERDKDQVRSSFWNGVAFSYIFNVYHIVFLYIFIVIMLFICIHYIFLKINWFFWPLAPT